MILALLIAAQVSLPAAQADAQAVNLAWIGGITSADLLTTSIGLRRCPQCYERNPFGTDAEARLALKLGTATAVAFGTWRLERSNHHGWAKALRWSYVAVTAGLVVNNSIHAVRRR